jgi:hypothetical protein
MQIRITRWTGSRCAGIVLAVHGSVLRVAIPGCDDAVVFSLRGGQWFREDGEPVEISFRDTEDADDAIASASKYETAQGCLSPNAWLAQEAAWVN